VVRAALSFHGFQPGNIPTFNTPASRIRHQPTIGKLDLFWDSKDCVISEFFRSFEQRIFRYLEEYKSRHHKI
jgi:hypothetical protein